MVMMLIFKEYEEKINEIRRLVEENIMLLIISRASVQSSKKTSSKNQYGRRHHKMKFASTFLND